jgi:hypothetical protein
MAIASTDIQYRLSGGAGNTSPAASLGGAKSTTAAGASIFDDVASAEAMAGDTEYRCVYVHNAHASLTLVGAVFWIQANTPSPTTTFDVGVGTSAVNGTEQTVADENTAPIGVTFAAAGSQGAVWLRRTLQAGTGSINDAANFRTTGDTAP